MITYNLFVVISMVFLLRYIIAVGIGLVFKSCLFIVSALFFVGNKMRS